MKKIIFLALALLISCMLFVSLKVQKKKAPEKALDTLTTRASSPPTEAEVPQAKKEADPARSRQLLDELNQAKSRKNSAELLRFLAPDMPPVVQDSAVEVLTDLKSVESLKAIGTLASSQDSIVLTQVMKSLSTLAEASSTQEDKVYAVAELHGIYQRFTAARGTSAEVSEADLHRSNAIDALGRIRGRDSEEALLDILTETTAEPYMQYFVVASLGKLKVRRALPALDSLAASLSSIENPGTEDELSTDALLKAIEKATAEIEMSKAKRVD